MLRDFILKEIIEILVDHSFKTSHIYDRSCFDIVARGKLWLLLLKVLINIDGFRIKQAEEIKKVASTFLASPFIVGVRSKNEFLEEDVVYERHGIPAIALETLRNMIVDEIYPEVFADRGGYFVQIDGNTLKENRESENLSLKELADIAHVSRETIYKYEHGRVRACPETAIMLESVLNTKIVLSIDLFKTPKTETENKTESITKQEPKELVDLGFGVIPTTKTPFDALAKADFGSINKKSENPLITNMERNRNQRILRRMAINVKDLSGVTESEAVFLFESKKDLKTIEGIPVVHCCEIGEMETSGEFLSLVRERRECS
ncbi:MAG: transcriptional regulator [Euryarchaeota archaeon]|nr:transcriptional regulator [Euryarchaeota archaeon]